MDASVSGLHGIGLVSDDTANRVKENLAYDRAQRAKFFSQLPTNFLISTKESFNKMLELPGNLIDPSKTWRDVADSTKGTLNIAGTVYGGVKLVSGLAKAGTSFVKSGTSIFDNMGPQAAGAGAYGNISGWGNIKAAVSSAGKDVGTASLMNMSKLKPTSPISKSKPANSASTNLNKTKGLVDEGTGRALNSFDDVAGYIQRNRKLPDNFITKDQARALGWKPQKGNLAEVAPEKSIGGDLFKNTEGKLPLAPGRIWYEADINYSSGFRGDNRILYSNDGLIYKTTDHYSTFTQIK